jgi:predicted transposase YbfD/YdcC
VKANQKTLHCQVRSQLQGKRQIPFVSTDNEVNHGREISWIVEVAADGIRDGKPFQTTHLFFSSLRTTPETLLKLVRDRWSIEGWHWISDTQLHEDGHRYRGNRAGVMATVRTPALNLLLLRLAEF